MAELMYVMLFVAIISVAVLLGLIVPGVLATGWVEKALLPFAILISVIAINSGENSVDGSLYKQLSWGLVFSISLYIFFRNERGFKVGEWLPWPYVLLILYCCISLCWTPILIVSAKRVVQIIGVAALSMAVFSQSHDKGLIRKRLLWPVLFLLFVGFCVAIVFPSIGFEPDGALRGITATKNQWGQMCLLSTLLCIFSIVDGNRRFVVMIGLFLGVLGVTISKSSTSLLATGISIFSVWLMFCIYYRSFWPRILLVFGACTLLVAALAFTVFTGELPWDAAIHGTLSGLGKNETLTGRDFLWKLMSLEIARHPWFGIGYGGFWNLFDGPSRFVISKLTWGPPSQAHNGYLDLWNELGYVGLSLTAALIARHVLGLWRIKALGFGQAALFHFCLLTAIAILNVAETTILRTTNLIWIIQSISIVEVYRLEMSARHLIANRV